MIRILFFINQYIILFFFFFSSRRRHTRCYRDWSSDVCSSDLSNDRFAWDAYRRFVQMFGKIVLDIPGDRFEEKLDEAKASKGPDAKDTDLDADDLRRLTEEFKQIIRAETGEDFPEEPRQQLEKAVEAGFGSWNGKRAVDYRRQNK